MELMLPLADPLFFTCTITVLVGGVVVPAVATFTGWKVIVPPGATVVGVVLVPER